MGGVIYVIASQLLLLLLFCVQLLFERERGSSGYNMMYS